METNHAGFDLTFGVRSYDTARTNSGEVPALRCDLAVGVGKVQLPVESNDRNTLFISRAVPFDAIYLDCAHGSYTVHVVRACVVIIVCEVKVRVTSDYRNAICVWIAVP